jgi:hypothetical protein
MATHYATDGKIGVDLEAIYASASAASSIQLPHTPGTTVATNNNGEAIFVRAESTIAQYDCVAIGFFGDSATAASGTPIPRAVPATTAGVAAAGVTGVAPRIGVAQVAITSAYYGWVFVKGTALRVNALVACQPKVQIFVTSTAGSVDDTVVSAGLIQGMTIITSATSASAPYCNLNNPSIAWYAVQA